MYVLQIRHKNDSEWRTYHKYHKYYIIAILYYIKARFDLLLFTGADDLELRIHKFENNIN